VKFTQRLSRNQGLRSTRLTRNITNCISCWFGFALIRVIFADRPPVKTLLKKQEVVGLLRMDQIPELAF